MVEIDRGGESHGSDTRTELHHGWEIANRKRTERYCVIPFLLPPPKNPCPARAKKASQAGRRRFDPGRPLFLKERLVAGLACTLRWPGSDVQRATVPV